MERFQISRTGLLMTAALAGGALLLGGCAMTDRDDAMDDDAKAGSMEPAHHGGFESDRHESGMPASHPVHRLDQVAMNRLTAAVANPARGADDRGRDGFRHPVETLAFFGIQPTDTVIEITPGGGWYADILAPYLRDDGRYIGIVFDPLTASNEKAQAYYRDSNAKLAEHMAAAPAMFDRARIIAVSTTAPVLGPTASADAVLTFRNVHNWIGAETAPAMFSAFAAVLKPGGVLGVVEHRAKDGTAFDRASGYVTTAEVIALATAAGFRLDDQSEINANPADTKDHPNGVWTLPPVRRTPEGESPAKYDAIGESDRMTLRFIKN